MERKSNKYQVALNKIRVGVGTTDDVMAIQELIEDDELMHKLWNEEFNERARLQEELESKTNG